MMAKAGREAPGGRATGVAEHLSASLSAGSNVPIINGLPDPFGPAKMNAANMIVLFGSFESFMAHKALGRYLVLLIVSACVASAQGNFAHFTYGGGYTSTFTFVNEDTTTAAEASLFFYNDDGTAATVPVAGTPTVSSHNFTIPANGSTTVVLPDTGVSNELWGWAHLEITNYVPVSGQLTFRRNAGASSPATEAVVPMSGGNAKYLIPFPLSTPALVIPFDNTSGQHGTAIALANTTGSALSLAFEFDDPSGNVIATATSVQLPAHGHTAWLMTAKNEYPQTDNKVGTLKITGMTSSSDLAAVALWFSTSSNTLTTVLPIIK
jgi:hypothetical protein